MGHVVLIFLHLKKTEDWRSQHLELSVEYWLATAMVQNGSADQWCRGIELPIVEGEVRFELLQEFCVLDLNQPLVCCEHSSFVKCKCIGVSPACAAFSILRELPLCRLAEVEEPLLGVVILNNLVKDKA